MKEIKPQDLRIGNTVKYASQEFEIWEVRRDYVELDSERLNTHIHAASYREISPIPITEDILLKFGFTYDGDDIWVIGENLIDMGGIGAVEYDFYLIREGGVYFHGDVRVNSAHELQNIVKDLTQKELTYQP